MSRQLPVMLIMTLGASVVALPNMQGWHCAPTDLFGKPAKEGASLLSFAR